MSADSGDDISPRVISAIGHGKPFALFIIFNVPTSENDAILKQFKETAKIAAEGTEKEDGCGRYKFIEDIDHAGQFYLIEQWASVEALQKHFTQAHIEPFLNTLDQHKISSNIRILVDFDTPILAVNPSAENPLPDLAPDQGTPSSVRVSKRIGDEAPYYLIVNSHLPKAEGEKKDAIEGMWLALKAVAAETQKEAGCIEFSLWKDIDAPTERVVLIEQWKSTTAAKEHFGMPHMEPFKKAVAAAGPKMGFSPSIPML